MRADHSWGRARKKTGGGSRPYRFLAFGAALTAAALAIFTLGGVPLSDGDGTPVLAAEEVAAVGAFYGGTEAHSEKEDDPPGVLNGRWNFWEFVGDTIASIFVKK